MITPIICELQADIFKF